MSDDGLPSDDQLRRIERGVMGRIDARRALRNRVVGAVTAVVLVGGGFGLVASALHSGVGLSSGSSAASEASPAVVVRCALDAGSDTSGARTVKVQEGSLPQSAVAACVGVSVDFQSGEGRMPSADGSTSSTSTGGSTTDRMSTASPSVAPAGVLCTDVDGSLVVLSFSGSASATCVKAGMEPYSR